MTQAKGEVGKLETWDSLVGELYESVLNPTGLLTTLKRIDSWIGSSFCHLLIWDDANNRQHSGVVTETLFGSAIEKYRQYYGTIDPRRELMNSQSPGTVWACHDHFDQRFVSNSEFYQDLLIPIGARYILLGYILKQGTMSAYIVFNHLAGQGHFSDQQKRVAAMLIPHLQRTIKLTSQSEAFRGSLSAGVAGLDALEQAVFTLDASGKIIFFNEKASALLKKGHWIKMRDGHLEAYLLGESEKLASAFFRVRLSRQAETLALHGGDNASGRPEKNQLITVLPMPASGVTHSGANHSSLLDHRNDLSGNSTSNFSCLAGTELVVLVTPQRRTSVTSAASLRALFKLTPAEARLTHELAKGTSIDEYADAAAISVATARTQLRSVLAKTGEKRLQDLVRLLGSLPTIL